MRRGREYADIGKQLRRVGAGDNRLGQADVTLAI